MLEQHKFRRRIDIQDTTRVNRQRIADVANGMAGQRLIIVMAGELEALCLLEQMNITLTYCHEFVPGTNTCSPPNILCKRDFKNTFNSQIFSRPEFHSRGYQNRYELQLLLLPWSFLEGDFV